MLRGNSKKKSSAHGWTRFRKYGTELRTIPVLLGLIGLLYCFGCSSANYGALRRDREVAQVFETYQIYPEHRYYYLHLENSPFALIALHKSFTVPDKQWTEFDPQTEKLEKLVDLVKLFPVDPYIAYGANLMDPLGNQIGYWYSSIHLRTLKVDHESKRVSIYTDTPWLKDRGRGRHRRFGSGIGIDFGQ